MKRGFPQKIEPLLPHSINRGSQSAFTASPGYQFGDVKAAGSVVDAVQQIKAEAIASVVRQDDGVDLIEGLIKPAFANSANQRRVRTSAAVMGLALSMGASDIFSVLKTQRAVAAEAVGGAESAQRSAELALELQALAESAQRELEAGLYAESPRYTEVPAVIARSGQSQSQVGDSPSATVASEHSLHVIQPGETLYGIARAYGVSVDKLSNLNGIDSSSGVTAGATLTVPTDVQSPVIVAQAAPSSVPDVASSSSGAELAIAQLRERREALRQNLRASTSPAVSVETSTEVPEAVDLSQLTPYRVQPGDTVDSIARRFSVERSQLISVNRLTNPSVLKVDQNIAIPQAEESKKDADSSLRLEVASLATAAARSIEVTPPSGGIEVQLGESTLPQVAAVNRSSSLAVPTSRPIEPFKPSSVGSKQASTHRVAVGETLAKIARNYGISLQSLAESNRITDPDIIFVGQSLVLPADAQAQTVASTSAPEPAKLAATQASVSDTKPSSEVDYVDSLMDEIRNLRQKYRSDDEDVVSSSELSTAPVVATPAEPKVEPAETTQPTVTTQGSVSSTSVKPEAARISRALPKPALQPQLPVEPTNSVVGSIKVINPLPEQKVAEDKPQLVAAASIGSEAYEPLAQSLLRQSVAPGLPPLDSDPYLPSQASKGYIWPAQGVLTSGYGWRWGRMHKGIDIAGPTGTPINAAASGMVTYSGWASGYGNLVEITHTDGTVTLYAHNNRNVVREGDRVRQGQHIADMGSTGRSTGPHLHFEIRPSGRGAVNPAALLPAR